ncbi:hypothetical protein C8R46DRAFT_1059341, partial [Mycena filopes]
MSSLIPCFTSMFQALEHPLKAAPACLGITTISSLRFARGRRHDFLGAKQDATVSSSSRYVARRHHRHQGHRGGAQLSVRVGLTCLHSFRASVAPRKPGATTQHAAVGGVPPGCLRSWCVLSCAYFSRLTNSSCIRIVRTCVGCLCRLCTRYHTFDRHPTTRIRQVRESFGSFWLYYLSCSANYFLVHAALRAVTPISVVCLGLSGSNSCCVGLWVGGGLGGAGLLQYTAPCFRV